MATDSKGLELDPTETPVIFGLWQSIPSDEPTPPTTSNIVKYMAKVLNAVSWPVAYLFYIGDKIPLAYGRIQHLYLILLTLIIPIALFCLNYFYIAEKIKKAPAKPTIVKPKKPNVLRLKKPDTSTEEAAEKIPDEKKKWKYYNENLRLWESYDYKYKIWNEYYAKVKSYTDGIQDRTISYMICIWMVMITSLVLFFPRLQNAAK